ncbi:MAG: hypothetical protein ACOY0T_40980 [Myxococcota bacterium]
MLEEAERVATVLRSLPEALLRVAFLRDYLNAGDSAAVARVFDELASASSDGSDRTAALLPLVMLLAGLADDPALDRLGHSAAAQGLPRLSRLLRRGAELSQVQTTPPMPDYGAGRELSVGERKSLARTRNRAAFDKLLRDPHPLVIQQLLENPRLTEDDLVRLAARRPANVEALRAIARTQWLCRPRVRMALIHNPGTPTAIAVPLLAVCTRPELHQVRASSECSELVREIAEELLVLRSVRPPRAE